MMRMPISPPIQAQAKYTEDRQAQPNRIDCSKQDPSSVGYFDAMRGSPRHPTTTAL